MSFNSTISPYRRKFLSPEEVELFYNQIIFSARSRLIGTFTFESERNAGQADLKFRRFFSEVSQICEQEVGWIRGEERSPYPSGASNFQSLRHFHAVILSHDISPEGVQSRWNRYLGNCKCERYDPARGNGIGYCLKERECDQVEWALSANIFLWRPGYEPRDNYERQIRKRHLMKIDLIETERKIPLAQPYKINDAFPLVTPSSRFKPVNREYREDTGPPVYTLSDQDLKKANDLLQTQGKAAMEKFLKTTKRKPFVQEYLGDV